MTIGSIGPLPSPPEEYDPVYMQQLVDRLEQIHRLLSRQIGTGWQMTNVTADTVLDADSTSTAELADVLGTLVTQMKDRGLLGG
jgi:hypothetical protein|tara:strand:+ start:2345 stop:2596 length:252 start_codon:yes stop_codon:yes gene_type:complete